MNGKRIVGRSVQVEFTSFLREKKQSDIDKLQGNIMNPCQKPDDPEQESVIVCAVCGTPISFDAGQVYVNGPSYVCKKHAENKSVTIGRKEYDIKSVKEAREKCKLCQRHKPHVHFYVRKHIRQYSTFEECLSKISERRIEYHETHGKGGFLSERTDEDYISPESIRKAAEHAYEMDQLEYELDSFQTFDMLENSKEFEEKEGFQGIITGN